MGRQSRYKPRYSGKDEESLYRLMHYETCDGCDETVPMVTNAVIGQITGIVYIRNGRNYMVKGRCLKCHRTGHVKVPEDVVNGLHSLPMHRFEQIQDLMHGIACMHEGSWMLSPVTEVNGQRMILIFCGSCKRQEKILL